MIRYGGLPCMRGAASGIGYDGQPRPGGQPRPLGVASVAGVFCLLGLGMTLGVIILIGEHIFYKYSLPKLRQRPKNSIWRSRNVMFFSQKLYRFINCVELVSPHHAARELMHTVRQGQITSLFQKSVKRVSQWNFCFALLTMYLPSMRFHTNEIHRHPSVLSALFLLVFMFGCELYTFSHAAL